MYFGTKIAHYWTQLFYKKGLLDPFLIPYYLGLGPYQCFVSEDGSHFQVYFFNRLVVSDVGWAIVPRKFGQPPFHIDLIYELSQCAQSYYTWEQIAEWGASIETFPIGSDMDHVYVKWGSSGGWQPGWVLMTNVYDIRKVVKADLPVPALGCSEIDATVVTSDMDITVRESPWWAFYKVIRRSSGYAPEWLPVLKDPEGGGWTRSFFHFGFNDIPVFGGPSGSFDISGFNVSITIEPGLRPERVDLPRPQSFRDESSFNLTKQIFIASLSPKFISSLDVPDYLPPIPIFPRAPVIIKNSWGGFSLTYPPIDHTSYVKNPFASEMINRLVSMITPDETVSVSLEIRQPFPNQLIKRTYYYDRRGHELFHWDLSVYILDLSESYMFPDVTLPVGSVSTRPIKVDILFQSLDMDFDGRFRFYGVHLIDEDSETPPLSSTEDFYEAYQRGGLRLEKGRLPLVKVNGRIYCPVLSIPDHYEIDSSLGPIDYGDFTGWLGPLSDEIRSFLEAEDLAVWDLFFGDLTGSLYSLLVGDLKFGFLVEDVSTGEMDLVWLDANEHSDRDFYFPWTRVFWVLPSSYRKVYYAEYGNEDTVPNHWNVSLQVNRRTSDPRYFNADITSVEFVGLEYLTSELRNLRIQGLDRDGTIHSWDITPTGVEVILPAPIHDDLEISFELGVDHTIFDFVDSLYLYFGCTIPDVGYNDPFIVEVGRRHTSVHDGRLVEPVVGEGLVGSVVSLRDTTDLRVPVKIFDIDEDLFHVVPDSVNVIYLDNFVDNIFGSPGPGFTLDSSEFYLSASTAHYERVEGVLRVRPVLEETDKYVRGGVFIEIPDGVADSVVFRNVFGSQKEGYHLFIEGKISDLTPTLSKEEALRLYRLFFWLSAAEVPVSKRVPIKFHHKWWIYDSFEDFTSDQSASLVWSSVNIGYLELRSRGEAFEVNTTFTPKALFVLDYTDYYPEEVNPRIYTGIIEIRSLEPDVVIPEVYFDVWRSTSDIFIGVDTGGQVNWVSGKEECLSLLNSLIDRSSTAPKQTLTFYIKIRPKYYGFNFGVIDPGAFMQGLRPTIAIPYVFIKSDADVIKKYSETYFVKKEKASLGDGRILDAFEDILKDHPQLPVRSRVTAHFYNSSQRSRDLTVSLLDNSVFEPDTTVIEVTIPPRFVGFLSIEEDLDPGKYLDYRGGILRYEISSDGSHIDYMHLPIPGIESFIGSLNYLFTIDSMLDEPITTEYKPVEESVRTPRFKSFVSSFQGRESVDLRPGEHQFRVPLKVVGKARLNESSLREMYRVYRGVPGSFVIYVPIDTGVKVSEGIDASIISLNWVDPSGGPFLTLSVERGSFDEYSFYGSGLLIVDASTWEVAKGIESVKVRMPDLEDLLGIVFNPETLNEALESLRPMDTSNDLSYYAERAKLYGLRFRGFQAWVKRDYVSGDLRFRGSFDHCIEISDFEFNGNISYGLKPKREWENLFPERLSLSDFAESLSDGKAMDLYYEALMDIKSLLDRPFYRFGLRIKNHGIGGLTPFRVTPDYQSSIRRISFMGFKIPHSGKVFIPNGDTTMEILVGFGGSGNLDVQIGGVQNSFFLVKDIVRVKELGGASLHVFPREKGYDCTQSDLSSVLFRIPVLLMKIDEVSYVLDRIKIYTDFPGRIDAAINIGPMDSYGRDGLLDLELTYSKHSLELVGGQIVVCGIPSFTGVYNFDFHIREFYGGEPREKMISTKLVVHPPHVLDDEYFIIRAENLDYSKVSLEGKYMYKAPEWIKKLFPGLLEEVDRQCQIFWSEIT